MNILQFCQQNVYRVKSKGTRAEISMSDCGVLLHMLLYCLIIIVAIMRLSNFVVGRRKFKKYNTVIKWDLESKPSTLPPVSRF